LSRARIRQAKVLTTARAMYRAADGVPPTQQAVADRLGLSKPTMHGHAQELRRKGWLVAGEKRLVPWACPSFARRGIS
jgi:biotin operon repressor